MTAVIFCRAKYHKLKFGTDLIIQDGKPPGCEESSTCTGSEGGAGDAEVSFTSVSNITWRRSRQLLRQ